MSIQHSTFIRFSYQQHPGKYAETLSLLLAILFLLFSLKKSQTRKNKESFFHLLPLQEENKKKKTIREAISKLKSNKNTQFHIDIEGKEIHLKLISLHKMEIFSF